MNRPPFEDLSSLSMLELFRVEAENQGAMLTSGLLALEREPTAPQPWDMLMRAAHSLKGAARIVNLQAAVRLAHGLEDCFAAAQQGRLQFGQADVDLLLRTVDMLLNLAKPGSAAGTGNESDHGPEVQPLLDALRNLLGRSELPASANALRPREPDLALARDQAREASSLPVAPPGLEPPERVVRLGAENLNRLLGLAGESLVESRWLRPFAESLQRLKRQQADLTHRLQELRAQLSGANLSVRSEERLNELFQKAGECQQFLAERIQELDVFDRRSAHLSQRLYLEALRTRMRPFGDGTRRFARMARDLARVLGKDVKLEIVGETTQVDRDMLERLEAPLAHLLRNAVDHGCETPEQRLRAGKPTEGAIRLEARHSAGMLLVTVSDDGPGVSLERVREVVVQKNLASPAAARKLTEPELLDFLLLPGFTLRQTVTEISGRGVGLDVVQHMVRSVRGNIRIQNQPGRGLRIQLQLPLTLSVLRALLVEVGDEPYAVPLTQITRALRLPRDRVESLEGRHHFKFGGQPVGLLTAHQLLECTEAKPPTADLPVVILGDRSARYGLIVDRFLGQSELVVQPLDLRLGKIRDISAAALMEDGSPILILDVDDLLRSIEALAANGGMVQATRRALFSTGPARKRVLAVDDSAVVRELQRKLLTGGGYDADVAADGLEAWNALRSGHYDLVITDVDMPRMGGIELATLIKQEPRFESLPVMIVSYLDGDRDRLRGLEAGADYYLTKGSFEDETLLQAVADLIGKPKP
ncbi:MAG TPA: hybrid sensor histidine kinase/response regulator [Candidatus Acidoferrum sp.]|nr:hybrid sensor histidine kinase/response regulator [Candidatus Acidoferrum sp.]